MQNALKISFSNQQDVDEAVELGGKNVFKYKRSLQILILLGVVIVVLSIFLNQQEPDVAAKNFPEPVLNKSPESPQTTSRPLSSSHPLEENLDPVKTFETPPKVDQIKLTYTDDKNYLSINRYERFPRTEKITNRIQKPKVRDTVTPRDNPLILAGKGFHLNGLQSQPKAGFHMGFPHRLQKPTDKIELIPEDPLDLKLTQIKSSRDLIFHPLRQSLAKDNRQTIYQDDEKLEKKKSIHLQDIPETKLLLGEGKKSFLILRRGNESFDLMNGNEKINRENFNRW